MTNTPIPSLVFVKEEKNSKYHVIKPNFIKKIICKILGHKKITPPKSNSFMINTEYGNNITISLNTTPSIRTEMTYKPCLRCGIYTETCIYIAKGLSKNEQLIKDIIE